MRRVFNAIDRGFSSNITHTETAPGNSVEAIRASWAQALRCEFDRSRDAMLCHLAETTQELTHQYPNDPKVLLWNGIVLTGYAKSLGGLCALQLQARAKASLERAIALAPNDGAAYLYLGLLYQHTPVAPYSFGDETIARSLLEQGLKLTLSSGKKLHHT